MTRQQIESELTKAEAILKMLQRDRELDPPWYDTQIDSTQLTIANLDDQLYALYESAYPANPR